jgi:hypothetical protein
MNFSVDSQLRIPVDVGRDYAMWATITVKQKCGLHHTGISGPLHRNTHHPRISRGIWEDMPTFRYFSGWIRDRIHNLAKDKTLIRFVMRLLDFRHLMQMESNLLTGHGHALRRRLKAREYNPR